MHFNFCWYGSDFQFTTLWEPVIGSMSLGAQKLNSSGQNSVLNRIQKRKGTGRSLLIFESYMFLGRNVPVFLYVHYSYDFFELIAEFVLKSAFSSLGSRSRPNSITKHWTFVDLTKTWYFNDWTLFERKKLISFRGSGSKLGFYFFLCSAKKNWVCIRIWGQIPELPGNFASGRRFFINIANYGTYFFTSIFLSPSIWSPTNGIQPAKPYSDIF